MKAASMRAVAENAGAGTMNGRRYYPNDWHWVEKLGMVRSTGTQGLRTVFTGSYFSLFFFASRDASLWCCLDSLKMAQSHTLQMKR